MLRNRVLVKMHSFLQYLQNTLIGIDTLKNLVLILCQVRLKAIIEATEPDKLRKAVEEYSASVPKDIVMFRYKKLDLGSCLMLLSSLSRYGSMFKYELQIEQQRNYTITIHHNFGEKWSYWLKEAISTGLFKNVLGIMPKTQLSKSSVVFTFLLP